MHGGDVHHYLVASLALLVGCGGGIADLTVEDGAISGVVKVHFTSSKEGVPTVYYGKDGTFEAAPSGPAGTDHDLTLLGLQTGVGYTFYAEVDAGGKVKTSDEVDFTVQPIPDEVPAFTRTVWEPEQACSEGGYFLFSYIPAVGQSGVAILDRDGRYVWGVINEVEDGQIGRPRPSRDGTSLLWNYADIDREDDLAGIIRMSMDGETSTTTRTLNGHHDFVELPDGTLGWLGYDFREVVLDDPDLPAEYVDTPMNIAVDTIYEGPDGLTDTGSTTEIFNVHDHYTPGLSWLGRDMRFDGFLPGAHEFSHGNSLAYLEEEDAYIMMFRWLDAMVKVDRATGAMVWQFGGEANDFAPAGADDELHLHGHFSEAWDDQVVVFDNGPHYAADDVDEENDYSRLSQYTLDESSMTYDRTWLYDSDRYEALLGDVRRMSEDCDNMLVSFSGQGRIVEMTRDGTEVWAVSGAIGSITSRVHYLPDLYDLTDAAYP